MSHVAVTFDSPEDAANMDVIANLPLLGAIYNLGQENETRFYKASTSELYGFVQDPLPKKNNAF